MRKAIILAAVLAAGAVRAFDASPLLQWITAVTGVSATGGVITNYTLGGINYRAHTFTNSGTFTVTAGGSVDALIVAGGGGGGFDAGGGGGAGGLIYSNGLSVAVAAYSVTVGSGGLGQTAYSQNATNYNGSNSVFLGMVTLGGGGGGGLTASPYVGLVGASGGSGGGGAGYLNPGNPGAGTLGQGNDGGAKGESGKNNTGSGGGGAGGVGGTGITNSFIFAPGGLGIESSISGASVTYATGGRGGGDSWAGATNGVANTGNGGDGAGNASAKNGGSGIVIIRYRTN
jgi:hypothetical protein